MEIKFVDGYRAKEKKVDVRGPGCSEVLGSSGTARR